MLFAIFCTDKPGRLETRLAVRATHLSYLERHIGKLVHAGPLLDTEGRPCGSLLLIDVADRTEAEGFAANDPYAEAGLFESTLIRGFRTVFRDGAPAG